MPPHTGPYWSIPVPTTPYCPIPVHIGLYWSLPPHTGPYWSVLPHTAPYCPIPVPTGPYWSVLPHSGPYRSILVPTGPYPPAGHAGRGPPAGRGPLGRCQLPPAGGAVFRPPPEVAGLLLAPPGRLLRVLRVLPARQGGLGPPPRRGAGTETPPGFETR